MNSKHDWANIQRFYDSGKSWRQVTAEFGVYNQSLRRAIDRGDLVTRTKTETLLIKQGSSSVETKCLECLHTFTSKSYRKRKYCSNACQVAHRWKTNDLPRILDGTADEGATRRYLLSLNKCCSRCGCSEWLGETLTLQMDHIDGNSDNNDLKNVRLLCPNCHSLTPTFGAKNRGKGIQTKRSKRDHKRIS